MVGEEGEEEVEGRWFWRKMVSGVSNAAIQTLCVIDLDVDRQANSPIRSNSI
jgi:hypothetical protein